MISTPLLPDPLHEASCPSAGAAPDAPAHPDPCAASSAWDRACSDASRSSWVPMAGAMMNTRLPAAADSRRTPGAGHHATECTGVPRLCVAMQRPDATSHTRRVPSSEPEASHWPLASGATQRTLPAWPSYVMARLVGKGCRSWGLGSLGTRVSGSMNMRFLRTRGHRYRSRQRSNMSLMKLGYMGTSRSELYARGTILGLSSGSISS
mmetsp:Transcript_28549/g.72642  ORF Transcript_28549/g.72642 Transcript_28549/m.72642 type:complete len:208 (-) Transcript_28549:1077-1700(-)